MHQHFKHELNQCFFPILEFLYCFQFFRAYYIILKTIQRIIILVIFHKLRIIFRRYENGNPHETLNIS